jgi:DNA ligase D-like protein (predicted 3'-phosphoesterase)
MALEEYWKKRKFEKTPEPKGKVKVTGKNRFVVHDHYAEKAGRHHDFRLEMEGVLKSWAVPKLMPEEKGVKRLAIEVESHPVDYIDFTGIIPKGEYGAGKVKIFDKGNYKLIEKDENKIVFELKGKKLKGVYNLIKLKGRKNQWIIFKTKNR